LKKKTITEITLATDSNACAEQAGAGPGDISVHIQPVCALRVNITLLHVQQAAVLQLFPGLDPGPEIFIAELGRAPRCEHQNHKKHRSGGGAEPLHFKVTRKVV